MKHYLIAILLLSSAAHAEVSRSFAIPLEGEKGTDFGRAQLSYLDACDRTRAELQGGALGPYLKSTSCETPRIAESLTHYRARGSLSVQLKRSLDITGAKIETGFVSDLGLAETLWGRLCDEFLSSGNRANPVLYASCGQKKVDTFYIKPAISSSALKVAKIRWPEPRGEYCQCRTRPVEKTIDTPWGSRPRYVYVYDLMMLAEPGYFEKAATFETSQECEDSRVKEPLCSAE